MIQKYKTIKEAGKPIWVLNPDEEYFAKVRRFFEMIQKLSDFKVKRGIQKLTIPRKES